MLFEAPFPFIVFRHERVASTNDTARALAARGAPHGTVVWALEQTAGRGRHGRAWFSPAGNLYLSVILRTADRRARVSDTGFLAALSVAEAADALLAQGGPPRCRLKWPNDVLLDGQKLAGILPEAQISGTASPVVILGIGVNLRHAPPAGTPYPATSLVASGVAEEHSTPERMLAPLLSALARWLARWESEGFGPARRAWMERAHGLGEEAVVRIGGTPVPGRVEAMDEDGALLLRTASGPRRVTAGEVAFGAA